MVDCVCHGNIRNQNMIFIVTLAETAYLQMVSFISINTCALLQWKKRPQHLFLLGLGTSDLYFISAINTNDDVDHMATMVTNSKRE